jgi:flagellar basal-body rod modification protein FlgD
MTGTNPIVSTPPPATPTPSSPPATSLSELGPNAFITLLTAQLQAQDPSNPMDPNQMVSELTSMNTLQETIQMRQDMDALVAAAKASSSSSSGSGTGTSANPSAPPNTSAAAATSSGGAPPHLAAAAMSSGLAAMVKSIVPGSASGPASQANSKSQLF